MSVACASESASARPARYGSGLGYLAGFFGSGLGLSALYATTGVGLPCPFRLATGWNCPFCGGTRMGSALLHGDLAAAFAFNPVALVGIAVLGIVGVAWTVERLGGPALRPPSAIVTLAGRASPNQWLIVGVVLAVVYTVVRNLV